NNGELTDGAALGAVAVTSWRRIPEPDRLGAHIPSHAGIGSGQLPDVTRGSVCSQPVTPSNLLVGRKFTSVPSKPSLNACPAISLKTEFVTNADGGFATKMIAPSCVERLLQVLRMQRQSKPAYSIRT